MSKSEAIHPSTPRQTRDDTGSGHRILYMEDDVAAARLLQKRLERAGYVVDVAHDGEEGLAMYAAGSYDVVVVDQNMPVRDGLEVIHLLASRGPLPPTIMVTGAGDEKTAVEAMKLGVGDYIVKDVDSGYLELLPSVIERVLQQRHLVEEKQQAEEALRVSEERFALALQGTNDGMWDWDIQNNSLYWSPRMKELLGYADDELDVDFETFDSHLHPDDKERMTTAIEAHLKDRAPYDVEQRLRTKSGEYRWFHARGQALWGKDGNPIRMVGFTTDITERKQAEEYLHRRNLELAALNALAQALASSLELQDLLDEALSRTVHTLGFAGGLISLTDERTGALVLSSYKGLPLSLVEHLGAQGPSNPLCNFVYGQGRSLDLGDLREGAPVDMPGLLKAGLRSYVGAPIVYKDRTLGTFCLFDTLPHPVSETEHDLLTAIGQQIGVAVENAWLFAETQKSAQQMEALYETSRALSSSLEEEPLMHVILKAVKSALDYEYVIVSTVDEKAGTIGIRHGIWGGELDVFPEWIQVSQYPLDHPDILADIYRTGRTEIVGEWDERFNREIWDQFGHERFLRIFMPIKVRNRVLGVIEVGCDKRQKDYISEDEVQMLAAFMDQTAVAMENARLFGETQRRAAQATLTYEVGRRVSSELELDELLSAIVTAVHDAFDYHSVMMLLLDEEVGCLALQSIAGGYADVFPEDLCLAIGEGMIGYAAATGETQVSEDVSKDSHYVRKAEEETKSELAVPIKSGRKVVGVLDIQSDELYAFDEIDVTAMEALSTQIATAIENAQLYEETQRRVRELRLLHDVGLAAASGVHLGETLQAAAEALAAELEGAHVALMLLDPESGTLCMEASIGYPSDAVKNLRLRLGEGITGWVAQHGEPALMADVRLDPRYLEWDSDIRSELCVPLIANSQIIGVLNVESPQLNVFTDDDQRLLSTLASNLTMLIERARLFEEVVAARVESQQRAEALEEANVRLQELDRLKSEFLANMSHEIRTPLNAVIGMTGLLLDTELTAEQQDYAETIRGSGDALLSLINDILDFSKIEAGRLELETQPFDLCDCVEESLDLLASKAAEKGLDLAYFIDDQVPHTVVGDVTRLRQILVNLLSNAVKFTEEGEVVVSATSRPLPPRPRGGRKGRHELHFAIRDTGIGIPKERIGWLFQSFSQVDASTTRKYGGTGLGLTISKRLAEMMGGTMWVESEVGQGSTFHFTIQAETAPAQKRVYLRAPEPELAGKRVLIVDDNETNRRILTRQTQSWGMLPRAAASGPEALELIHRGDSFDIAVLDMRMPEMDGLTLASEIRNLKSEIPLVMLTSLGQRQEGSQTVEFAAYLTKPIKPSQLYDVLVGIFAGQPVRVKEPATRPRFDPQMGQGHPLHILLAEDNVVNQKVALRILERMGYRADVAANGLEVLEALERQSYDVVLMDVQMPEMDGMEATRRICEQWPEERRPRIVAMTAHAMQGDRERYLAAGMDDYISKPVRVEELVEALRQCQSFTIRTDGSSPGPQATVVGSSTAAAIDSAVLEDFRAVMGEAALELIGLFLGDASKLLADLREAVARGEAEELQRAAHTLKSSSASLGAMILSTLCRELEAMGRAGTLEGAAEKVSQVEAEYQRVKAALEEQTTFTE